MNVLDSSFLADFLRGRDHAKRYRLDNTGQGFVVPAVALYELYNGALNVGRDPQDVDVSLPWVDRFEYTPAHALEGARIRRELQDSGRRISHPDMVTAGVARCLDAPVVATDGDFERVDGLTIENPRDIY